MVYFLSHGCPAPARQPRHSQAGEENDYRHRGCKCRSHRDRGDLGNLVVFDRRCLAVAVRTSAVGDCDFEFLVRASSGDAAGVCVDVAGEGSVDNQIVGDGVDIARERSHVDVGDRRRERVGDEVAHVVPEVDGLEERVRVGEAQTRRAVVRDGD